MVKNITILGSTGTIGENTLDVIRKHPSLFNVFALSVKKNLSQLINQIDEFKPKVVVLSDENAYNEAKSRISSNVKILFGEAGLKTIASEKEVDFVMAGIVGSAGIHPFIAALEAKKKIGLANKESLVMAGEYISKKFPYYKDLIIPVDSEHSAIFQCLSCGSHKEVGKLILTASGGPFLNSDIHDDITLCDALKHPNWVMGKKISIDSATMMNKGFELIEAFWLFPFDLDKISVLVHPQSIIHSMVEFIDGSVIAHLGVPDMRIPIQFALSYPSRLKSFIPSINLAELKCLTFENPDLIKFPSLKLSYDAIKKGGAFPTILNASNEVSVQSFIDGEIKFTDIYKCNEHVFNIIENRLINNLDDILTIDKLARLEAQNWISFQ